MLRVLTIAHARYKPWRKFRLKKSDALLIWSNLEYTWKPGNQTSLARHVLHSDSHTTFPLSEARSSKFAEKEPKYRCRLGRNQVEADRKKGIAMIENISIIKTCRPLCVKHFPLSECPHHALLARCVDLAISCWDPPWNSNPQLWLFLPFLRCLLHLLCRPRSHIETLELCLHPRIILPNFWKVLEEKWEIENCGLASGARRGWIFDGIPSCGACRTRLDRCMLESRGLRACGAQGRLCCRGFCGCIMYRCRCKGGCACFGVFCNNVSTGAIWALSGRFTLVRILWEMAPVRDSLRKCILRIRFHRGKRAQGIELTLDALGWCRSCWRETKKYLVLAV